MDKQKSAEMLTGLSKEIYEANKAKGFWDQERNLGECLMLIVSELGEAQEALRKGKRTTEGALASIEEGGKTTRVSTGKEESAINFENSMFKLHVKDTFEDELADAAIRIFDLAGGLNIDLGAHIMAKLQYNASRPQLHGKLF